MINEFKKNNKINEITYLNGFKVIIFHKPDFVSSSVALGINYGSLDYKQVDEDNNIFFVPSGTAHFLEHQMFQDKDGDLMSQFANLGASVNAFTSFEETVYYFQTTSKDLKEPLLLLLKLVSNLNIDEASVLKEQGIIIEELLMYLQLPDNRLYFETLKNLYHNYPLNQDIGGDIESVKEITESSLREAFNFNYEPSKMILVISSPILPGEIINIINNHPLSKNNSNKHNLKRYKYQEAISVSNVYQIISLPVDLSKITLGFKLDVSTFENKEELDLSLKFWLKSLFSVINPTYQSWLDKKIINDYFDYDLTIKDDYGYLIFFAEKLNEKELKDFIFSIIGNRHVSEADFIQIKRNLVASTASVFNSTMELSLTYLRSLLAGDNMFDSIELLNNIELETINNLIKEVSFNNFTVVEIK